MLSPIVFNTEKCSECIVHKSWGHEIIFENNEKYCGNLLVFNKDSNFSMHYHLIKDEAWYVQSGEFLFTWIDLEKAEKKEKKIVKELTLKQLKDWNCKYHKIICNEKPDYDLLICDKTKRIEEL